MILQLVANGLLAGCAYILLAIGFAMAKRETGFYDFSYALQFTVGAYVTLTLHSRGAGVAVATVIACSVAATLAAVTQRTIYTPLSRSGISPLGLLIISLAVYGVGQNVISLVWGDARQPFFAPALIGAFAAGPVHLGRAQMAGLVISLVGMSLVAVLVLRTSFGRAFRAVADDHELARLCGIPVTSYQTYAQALSGGLACVAGVVFALDTGVEPRMGFRALLVAVVAVVVGQSRVFATAAAAVGLGIAQHVSVYYISSRWQDAVALLILVSALVIRRRNMSWRRG